MVYISIYLLLIGVTGIYLYNLQKEKIEQSLITSRESVRSRIEEQFNYIEHNLELLKSYLQVLESGRPAKNKTLFTRLSSQTLGHHWIQFNSYLAFEKRLAQKYFLQDAIVLGAKRDSNLMGTPDYLDPKTFSSYSFKDPIYQYSKNEVWYHTAKKSKETEYTQIYFDRTYMKKWFLTASLGIYGPTGEFEGMVGIDVLFDELSLLTEVTPLGKTGGSLMIDTRTNQILTKLQGPPAEFIKVDNRYEKPQMSSTREEQWNQLLRSQNEIDYFTGDNQKNYIVSVHRFDGLPLAILTFQDYSEAFGPVVEKFSFLVLIGLMGLFILMRMLQKFSHSIATPISNLIGSIEKNIQSVQNDKSMAVNVQSSGYREVQHLSDLVNKLVRVVNERLQKHLRSVEEERAKSIHSARMASIGRLAGNIAHEINSPLTAIGLHTEVFLKDLEKDKASPEIYKSRLQSVRKLTDRIAKIVQGFLTLSREGKSDPLQPVSLEEVVHDTLNICRSKFKDSGARVIVDVIPNIPVSGRSVQLSQVLLNLLNNAYDAIEGTAEKWVHLKFKEFPDFIQIRVLDSGAGIPAEIVDKMMDPFFTTKDVHRGTGLGLSISKSIMEEHNGRLYYDPNCPHTCFVMEIPKAHAQSSQEKAAWNELSSLS